MTRAAANSPPLEPAAAADDDDDKSALLAARQRLLADMAERAQPVAQPISLWAQVLPVAVAVVLAAAAAYIWLGNPAWLRPTEYAIPEPSVASIDKVLTGTAKLVEASIRVRGEAPASLAQAGLPEGRFEYSRSSATQFSLSLRTNTKLVTLDVDAAPNAATPRQLRVQGVAK